MIYHVFNRSIAGYTIFNNPDEYIRMTLCAKYYRNARRILSFSKYLRQGALSASHSTSNQLFHAEQDRLVDVIAYCIMPTHIHFILNEIADAGISTYSNNVLNSYTHYFNIKHSRKGPLWEGRSIRVLIESDEQLLHVSRYIHLNPVTAYLVNRPEEWAFSSFSEYISSDQTEERICRFDDHISIKGEDYRRFVLDGILYQRELARIKHLAID